VNTSHVVDLDGGVEAVRSRLNRSVRRNLARAEKCGVHVETAAGDALLRTYFDLFEKARVDWARVQNEPAWLAHARGRLRESRQKWKRIAQQLGDRLRITVAWYDGAPAAAGIALTGPNVHFTRAAMDPAIRNVGASYLVCWEVLRDAAESGARWCFLGQAATKGAAEFNEYFGAQAFPSVELSSERLPITRTNELLRGIVKKAVRFDGTNAR
jgi:hypothetical protein